MIKSQPTKFFALGVAPLRRCVSKKSLLNCASKQQGEEAKRKSHATEQRRNVKKVTIPFCSFLSSCSHRHTQVQPSQKSRHFGMDADKFVGNEFGRAERGAKPEPHGCGEPIQAMDGNQTTVQVLDSDDLTNHIFLPVDTRASVVSHSLPSLDAGFRHPCRNDELVYNGRVWNPPLRFFLSMLLFAGVLNSISALALENLIKINAEQEQHIGIRTFKPEAISSIPLARAPARVTLPPQNEYIVSAAQAGLINRVDVAMGMKIAKAQVLAEIQSPSLLGLQRDVLDAVTGFNLAQAKLNRDTTLLEEGIIARMRYQETRSDYERYATALKETEQVLQAAGVTDIDIQTIKQTRKLNSFMNVRSPIDGVVLERMVTAGQRVDVLAPLFRIGRLDELWLEIDMPQERMNEVRMGDYVHIENTTSVARITQIGQSVNPGSQSALVRGIIEGKTQSIRPGQNVNVQISHASTDRPFSLPIAALIYQEGKSYVFVRAPGGFAARQVAVASTEERNVVIHEGLKVGDQVAVQGVAAIKAAWTGIGGDE